LLINIKKLCDLGHYFTRKAVVRKSATCTTLPCCPGSILRLWLLEYRSFCFGLTVIIRLVRNGVAGKEMVEEEYLLAR